MGHFDGGASGACLGEPIKAGAHSAAFEKLSKNPLKIRFVREQKTGLVRSFIFTKTFVKP